MTTHDTWRTFGFHLCDTEGPHHEGEESIRSHNDPTSLARDAGEGDEMRRFLFSTLVMVTASLAVGNGLSAASGDAAAAEACQQGGYHDVVRSDGSPFATVGDCVSYAARGGTFVAVSLSATFVADANRAGFQDLTLVGTGLQPGSTVTYSFIPYRVGLRNTPSPTEENHIVAPDGTFVTAWHTGCPLDQSFEFYATTAYGTPITATGC